jgi:hypothetical protein
VDIVEEIRKLLTELVVPELRAIAARLQLLADDQKAASERQRETELRLLREIQKSEEEILAILKAKVSDLTIENEELTRRLEEKKKAPTIQ